MKKDVIYQYLEKGGDLPHQPSEHELLTLLKEVENLEDPEPEPAYWNQFNHRLQAKLDARVPPKRFAFFKLPLWVGALASIMLAFFLFQPRATPALERLDPEALAFLSQFYEIPEEENEAYVLDMGDLDILLQTFGTGEYEDNLFSEDYDFSAEDFKDLWNREG